MLVRMMLCAFLGIAYSVRLLHQPERRDSQNKQVQATIHPRRLPCSQCPFVPPGAAESRLTSLFGVLACGRFGQSLFMCAQHFVLQVNVAPHRAQTCRLQFLCSRCSVVMYRLMLDLPPNKPVQPYRRPARVVGHS